MLHTLLLNTIAIRRGAALSGLLMVLFLLVHLGGLLLAVLAPAPFEAYATALHHSFWLPLFELALAATALLHIGFTTAKTLINREAGNTASLITRRQDLLAAFASRNTLIAALVSLAFLVVHLQQMRWPRPADGHERELLLHVLQQPVNLGLYAAGSVAIALHLLHGSEAAHRSLGWLHPRNSALLRQGGRGLAGLVGGGFLLISVALALAGAA